MPRLGWETTEYLVETVLDDRAARSDRLFALDRLLSEGAPASRFLQRIARECHDPFLRRVALLESHRWELLEASGEGLGHRRAEELLFSP